MGWQLPVPKNCHGISGIVLVISNFSTALTTKKYAKLFRAKSLYKTINRVVIGILQSEQKGVCNALVHQKPTWIAVSCRYRQYDIGNNRIRCNHYLRRPPNVYLLGVELERTSLYGCGLKVSRMLWEHDIK